MAIKMPRKSSLLKALIRPEVVYQCRIYLRALEMSLELRVRLFQNYELMTCPSGICEVHNPAWPPKHPVSAAVRDVTGRSGYGSWASRIYSSASCGLQKGRACYFIKTRRMGTFSGGPHWLRLCAPSAAGLGSIPSPGTWSHGLQLRVRMLQLTGPA